MRNTYPTKIYPIMARVITPKIQPLETLIIFFWKSCFCDEYIDFSLTAHVNEMTEHPLPPT